MSDTAAPAPGAKDPNALITGVACAATAALVLSAPHAWAAVTERPLAFLTLAAVTVLLQVVAVPVYDRGSISFAGTGLLALGLVLGAGAAIAMAVLMGVVNLFVRHGRLNRGVFDASQWALATGAGVLVYQVLDAIAQNAAGRFGAAVLAGAAAMLVNLGLLTFAMSLAEGTSMFEIWSERFRWFTPYYLASGPLAFALAVAYEKLGLAGVLAFALPPVFMMISVRQYLARTRQAVEEVRRKNEELEHAVAQLGVRNEDLRELLAFSGGLAARAHDRGELVAYAEQALARLTGTDVELSADGEAGVPLLAGGHAVGSVVLPEEFEGDGRWVRLSDVVLPQLATAIESADLVEQVRTTHLATIAALSRSMEAKDFYTGGHTERVAEVAVAVARRLGYGGSELDALQIGALLHDIGKIGVPEAILNKPGPLDEAEWKVMKEHPKVSEYILSGVDLPPIVLQIARSSHESYDGSGYPDALAGEDIPLPARIVLIADAFDAMTSDRPYRRGRHARAAMEEIRACAGTQFCPRVVAALEAVYREEPHVLGASTLRAVDVA